MKKINFIPESYVRRRARRRLAVEAAAVLAIVAVSAGWWLGPARAAEQRLDGRRTTLAREITTMIAQRDEEAAVPEPDGAPDRAALADRLAARVPTTAVIASLTESMPDPIGLSHLSLTAAPMKSDAEAPLFSLPTGDAEGVDPTAPLEIDIEGMAPDDLAIARFISRMDERSLFTNVELAYSRPVEGDALLGREFRITLEIPLNRTYVLGDEEAQVRHVE